MSFGEQYYDHNGLYWYGRSFNVINFKIPFEYFKRDDNGIERTFNYCYVDSGIWHSFHYHYSTKVYERYIWERKR